MIKKIVLASALAAVSAFALTLPSVSKFDKRITYAKYNADDVFLIRAKIGYVSMVKFGDEERILTISTGFANGWELIDVDNMLFVKPMIYQVTPTEQEKLTDETGKAKQLTTIIQPNAKDWATNLIIVTNKRLYTFDLELVEDKVEKEKRKVCADDKNATGCTFEEKEKIIPVTNDYTLTFAYPDEDKQKKESAKDKLNKSVSKDSVSSLKEEEALREQAIREQKEQERLEKEKKEKIDDELTRTSVPKNYDYVMHVNKDSEIISPDFVYDDGLFTYVGFRRVKTIPSFFTYHEEDGEPSEAIVATHLKKYDKFNVVVVHKTFDRLLLRNGNQLVGVKNNGYMRNEIDDLRTTKTKTVVRKVKAPDEGGKDQENLNVKK